MPHLTATGDIVDGTPREWVEETNAELRDSWDDTGSAPVEGTDYTFSDFFSVDNLEKMIVGQELRGVGRPSALTLEQSIENGTPISVGSDGLGTIDHKTDNLAGERGEFVVTFSGPPVETNGTVSGNSVVWTLTGTEASLYLFATGPIG